MAWSLRRMKLEKILKIIALFEWLYWTIIGGLTMLVYFSSQEAETTKTGIGQQSQDEIERKAQDAKQIEFATKWLGPTSVLMLLVQFFLWYGASNKNRCLLFSWIVFSIIIGIARIVIVADTMRIISNTSTFLRVGLWIWPFRVVCMLLAAQYMVQITNERKGQEEVEAPHFRPQSLDPRDYREGLNYPSYPRSLQFADRISGMNKSEHSHPKRWVPTYDAIDSDGRMVVVVDNPVYEAL